MHHKANKHSAPDPNVTSKLNFVPKKFLVFTLYVKNKSSQLGAQTKSSNNDMDTFLEAVMDSEHREQLRAFQLFLVASEPKKWRHPTYIFGISRFNTSVVNKKTNYMLRELKCATNFILAFGFNRKSFDDWFGRYIYAHGSKTFMVRSELQCS